MKYFSEFIATFLMVLFGTGICVLNDVYSLHLNEIVIAVYWALVFTVMILLFGRFSGAHMNPVVTLVLALDGKIEAKCVVPYILCQFAGGVLASVLWKLLMPYGTNYGATLPLKGVAAASVIEFLLSLSLIAVVLITCGQKRIIGAGAIFVTITINVLAGMNISGASMDPARSIGPALVSGNMRTFWIDLIMPMAGGLAAVSLVRLTRKLSRKSVEFKNPA